MPPEYWNEGSVKYAINTEPPKTPQKHTVAAGDTFESVANKYGVTVRELVNANPQLLKTGDSLTVPVAVAIPADSGSSSTPSTPVKRTYTVKPGDSLYAIAIKFGTTVAAIASRTEGGAIDGPWAYAP